MIAPEQCRAARALLNWTQEQLAAEAGVGVVTVRQFEQASVKPRQATVAVLGAAFERAGIEFTDEGGLGVRLIRKRRKRTGKGKPA